MKKALLTCVMVMSTTSAFAHSPLETTIPADDAVIEDVPDVLVLDFKGNIRLTRVTLTHAEKHSVDLDLDGFGGFISDYAVPLQSFGAGLYEIEWRGLGDDGHALNGTFSFSVAE